MDYIRNWRRYHAEVDALVQVGNSDQDLSPQSSETAEGNATENCNARENSGHDDAVDSNFDDHYSGSDNDYELQNIDGDQCMYDSFFQNLMIHKSQTQMKTVRMIIKQMFQS